MSTNFKQVLSANCKMDQILPGVENLPIFPQDLDELIRRLARAESRTAILRDINTRRYKITSLKPNSDYPEYEWRLKLMGGSAPLAGGHAHADTETETQSRFSRLTDIIRYATQTFVRSQEVVLQAVDRVPNIILQAGATDQIVVDIDTPASAPVPTPTEPQAQPQAQAE